MSSLVPKIDRYLEHDLNVLLIGYHGVGKTFTVKDAAEKAGVRLKYYSCATLDPYTDLVGIPVPRKDSVDEDGNSRESLHMIRPREIDEAELIFFDELNRADPKVLNAVMEIIQFGSINGEKLPNLRACWAAINPPGEAGYNVEELDPAIVDRFDVYVQLDGKPDVSWMVNAGLPKEIAQALKQFWTEHSGQKRGIENMISPRKLFTIGKVFMLTNDVEAAIPNWISYEKKKLRDMLTRAKDDYERNNDKRKETDLSAVGRTMGNGASNEIVYTPAWLAENRDGVSNFLKNNPEDLDTHQAVMDALRACHGHRLVRDHAEILDALKPSILEGFVSTLSINRSDLFIKAMEKDLESDRSSAVPNLRKALGLA